MSDTLRNQLLGLGFTAPVETRRPAADQRGPRPGGAPRGKDDERGRGGKPGSQARRGQSGARDPAAHARPGQGRPNQNESIQGKPGPGKPGQSRRGDGRPGRGKPRSQEDIDLAKAYAIRAQREKDERIAAEQAKQEEARKRREARAQVTELVKGKGLNAEDADIARHFEYGGKIKRVYVTADQLKALNAGELGVLQLDGRYVLVTAELLAQAEAVFAPSVALKVDPDAPVENDPYADPKYQVPDDLVW